MLKAEDTATPTISQAHLVLRILEALEQLSSPLQLGSVPAQAPTPMFSEVEQPAQDLARANPHQLGSAALQQVVDSSALSLQRGVCLDHNLQLQTLAAFLDRSQQLQILEASSDHSLLHKTQAAVSSVTTMLPRPPSALGHPSQQLQALGSDLPRRPVALAVVDCLEIPILNSPLRLVLAELHSNQPQALDLVALAQVTINKQAADCLVRPQRSQRLVCLAPLQQPPTLVVACLAIPRRLLQTLSEDRRTLRIPAVSLAQNLLQRVAVCLGTLRSRTIQAAVFLEGLEITRTRASNKTLEADSSVQPITSKNLADSSEALELSNKAAAACLETRIINNRLVVCSAVR